MSIRAIDWAFRQKTGSAASKLVLIKLADNANDDGRCYPSLAYIAEHCDMHRSTVIRHISALADLGLVEVEHRSVEGTKIPNVYHLKMLQVVAGCDQGSRTLQPGVVAGCDQGSRTLQHRTVIEPSVKPGIEIEIASPTAPPNECGASTVQPVPIKPKPRPREASQGTRLPTDWVLTQELGEWALSEGLTRDRIRQEADRFRDYWIAKPGAAGRKTDWPATWRNWVRRASETKTGGTNGQGGRPDRESVSARAVREAAEFIADLDAAERAERCQADGSSGIHENELALPWEGVGRL